MRKFLSEPVQRRISLCVKNSKPWPKCIIRRKTARGERKDFPTEHSVLLQKFDHIYCCGPEPMMKAVAAYAVSGKIDCQVSLEHTMGCGIGACLCCVTETATGNKCVCTEGAVFNINELKWRI